MTNDFLMLSVSISLLVNLVASILIFKLGLSLKELLVELEKLRRAKGDD